MYEEEIANSLCAAYEIPAEDRAQKRMIFTREAEDRILKTAGSASFGDFVRNSCRLVDFYSRQGIDSVPCLVLKREGQDECVPLHYTTFNPKLQRAPFIGRKLNMTAEAVRLVETARETLHIPSFEEYVSIGCSMLVFQLTMQRRGVESGVLNSKTNEYRPITLNL